MGCCPALASMDRAGPACCPAAARHVRHMAASAGSVFTTTMVLPGKALEYAGKNSGGRMITLKINGATRQFDGDPDMPLLWYLRDVAGLTGSKFGCGMGL